MQNRVLSFTGIHNFRDYGGYRTRDGARLATGMLFRSGQHLDADADDLARVAALDLATVIDLRSARERELFPCPRPAGFAANLLLCDADAKGLAIHDEAARNVETPEAAHSAMVALYQRMAWRPELLPVYRGYFDALANRDGASLIHCVAGKDRTGLAVSLFQHVMGVHDDDIMADYLLTNVAGNPEARIEAGAKTVRVHFGNDLPHAALRTVMSCHADFLSAAFAAIVARHGSVTAYAEEMLGVTPAQREAIAARWLVN